MSNYCILKSSVFLKRHVYIFLLLSRETTLISSQMRSPTSFSRLTASSVGPFDCITFKRKREGFFLSRFTIYLVTRLFADFSPSHGGWLARDASSAFVASLILGLLSKLSGYLVEMSGISDSRCGEELLC